MEEMLWHARKHAIESHQYDAVSRRFIRYRSSKYLAWTTLSSTRIADKLQRAMTAEVLVNVKGIASGDARLLPRWRIQQLPLTSLSTFRRPMTTVTQPTTCDLLYRSTHLYHIQRESSIVDLASEGMAGNACSSTSSSLEKLL
jgi:hypothetical protein